MTYMMRAPFFITQIVLSVLTTHAITSCQNSTPSASSDIKMFGGIQMRRADFPAAMDLWKKTSTVQDPSYLQYCSASFIHPRVILTAAHCIGLDSDSTNTDPNSVSHIIVNGNLNIDQSEAALQANAQKEKALVIAHLEEGCKEAEGISSAFGKQRREQQKNLVAKLNAKKALTKGELRFVASALVAKTGWKPVDGKVFPGYGLKPRGITPDIGLLLLAPSVKASPARMTNTAPKAGEILEFVGFGFQNSADLEASSLGQATLPRTLRMAENSPIIDPTIAKKYEEDVDWNRYFASVFSPQLFSKNPKHGLGCRGDSGGPVFRRFKNEIAIVGVTSRIGSLINSQGVPAECEMTPFAMIYNRIDNPDTQKWINETLKAWGL